MDIKFRGVKNLEEVYSKENFSDQMGTIDISYTTVPYKNNTDISNVTKSFLTDSVPEWNDVNKPRIEKNETNIDEKIRNYNVNNINSFQYDAIDNDGNFLINNNEIEPTIHDGLLKDTKEALLLQNSIYIIGSIITTACLIITIISR